MDKWILEDKKRNEEGKVINKECYEFRFENSKSIKNVLRSEIDLELYNIKDFEKRMKREGKKFINGEWIVVEKKFGFRRRKEEESDVENINNRFRERKSI